MLSSSLGAESSGSLSSSLSSALCYLSDSAVDGPDAAAEVVANGINGGGVAAAPALAADNQVAFVNQQAQTPEQQNWAVAIRYLNAVRFIVAESNKWPNEHFRWRWQWGVRRAWHTARQGQPARANVINGNNGITPTTWRAAADAVLDQRDAYGVCWGNCAEQASLLAAFLYENTQMFVRVCYQGGHAWTEARMDANATILRLDPWGDSVTTGAGGGSCTHWYQRNGNNGWNQQQST